MKNNFVYIDQTIIKDCITLLQQYKTGNYMNTINIKEIDNDPLELIQSINSLGDYLNEIQLETILLKRELKTLS